MERLGIFGGSFNPVHLGHLILAQDAMESFGISKVFFVPAAVPPHKTSAHLASAEDREAMLRLAVEGDRRFDVWDDELRRGGISYSVETVRRMRARFPEAELFFIIGADTLREIHLWREIEAMLSLCEVITVARPGFSVDAVREEHVRLRAPWPERLGRNVMTGHAVEISSTDIRFRVARGKSIRYLVPAAVERYIAERGLYRSPEGASSTA